jgi:Rieske 2Fe-2S family protein
MNDRTQPLFRAAELEAVLQPVEAAHNLPGGLYVEPQVFALEQATIFASGWVCVGRAEDLGEAGAFLSVDVAGRSVLVVRGADDSLRAFHNVCRHRGACLTQEASGVTRAFRCNYHAWTYGTEGQLVNAPLMDERPGFDAAQYGLAVVRLETWGGFVFVNLDDTAATLEDAMAEMPDVSRYDLASLRRAHSITYDVAANWKVLCENYSECYHCALAHPQLHRLSDFRSGGRSFEGTSFNGGPMGMRDGFTTMSTSGERRNPEIEGITEQDRRHVHYLHFYPSFLIGLAPDYVVVHRVQPLDPGHSRVVCEWFYPATSLARPDFDATEAIEFWDVTNRQDWQLCEMVQQGAAAGLSPGPYHPLEYCVHAFDRWFITQLGEQLAQLRS